MINTHNISMKIRIEKKKKYGYRDSKKVDIHIFLEYRDILIYEYKR